MHPSHDIRGSKSVELANQRIVLCITGSVAAVKCHELARELMRHGADVRVVMTRDAAQLVTPKFMYWATGNPVVSELTGKLEHVELATWADLILVAPATANTLSKVACAIDDTPVTSVISVAMGLGKLVAMVPAMHGSMYSHKLLKNNLARLKAADVKVLEPKLVEGKAKLPGIEEITNFAIDLLGPKDMVGMHVLITAGPTIEHIDPIKFITNKSSGKMGIAVARAAASRGADVTLIYGPGFEEPPANVKVIRVNTTTEMRKAFVNEMKRRPDIVVSTAAPQDFVVAKISKEKLRHYKPLSLKLVPAPRVVNDARELAPKAFIVGFKAEHDISAKQLKAAAIGKLREGNFDMVVANDVSRQGAGFGADTNEVEIVTSSSSRHLKASKAGIAKIILDAAIEKLWGSQR